MVAIMASLNDSSIDCNDSDAKRNICYGSHEDKLNKQHLENPDSLNIVRSVAMSANVAFAVVDEVKHFIHVNSFDGEISSDEKNLNFVFEFIEDGAVHVNINRQEHEHDYFHSLLSSCSFVLPSNDGAIVSAVVLSKWDDVIGPQTVHAWLRNTLKCDECTCHCGEGVSSVSVGAHVSVCSCGLYDSPSQSGGKGNKLLSDTYIYKKRLQIFKALKYITSHTVNYSVGSAQVDDRTAKRNLSVFIVPEVDLVAQCRVFHRKYKERSIPYSLAVVVNYHHCKPCLQLSHYCRHWLQESSARIQEMFVQCAESNRKFKVTEEVNNWVLELSSRMMYLGSLKMTTLSPSDYSGVLYNHFLPFALTSHLQTFCCSVVSGTSVHYINMLISFLALFLENGERTCSSFVNSTTEYTFDHGLFLQGMLTNKHGLQKSSSLTFGKHLDPITSISILSDVQLDHVSPSPFHWRYLAHLENNLHEVGIVRNNFEPVKCSASLVNAFINDMSKLPSTHWKSIIFMFKRKLNIFGHMLLTLVSTLRESDCRSKLVFQGDLCERMGICGADFLIILAVAEKLKPGTYNCIIECDQTYT